MHKPAIANLKINLQNSTNNPIYLFQLRDRENCLKVLVLVSIALLIEPLEVMMSSSRLTGHK